jgi:predicted acyltransferase
LILSLIVAILYFAIFKLGLVTIFDNVYLGGYQGAIFYLPVMLAGAYLGKGILEKKIGRNIRNLFVFAILASIILALIFPIDKTRVSPSFMALSVLLSTIFFAGVHKIVEEKKMRFNSLEFLGRAPLRYWILMFVFFQVPYGFCVVFEQCSYPLEFSALYAFVITAIFMLFIAIVSLLIDKRKNRSSELNSKKIE